MSYRVETALSSRAVCTQTECKNAGIKIEKDELRFGVWVNFRDSGSFRWKHWGCVTGKQLQHLREYLDPEGTGNYEWDKLDGYDDEGKGGLVAHPDLQEKVRRVVTQGFIDPEDFNGDPEMNKLGESGLRTAESKKKMREDAKSRKLEIAELEAKLVAKDAEVEAVQEASTKKSKKRVKHDSDEEVEDFERSKPAPKKRASKIKTEDEGAADVKLKPKRGRKAANVKEEIADDDDGSESELKPKAKRSRKAAKEEADHGVEPDVKPKANKGGKAPIKEELDDDVEPDVKGKRRNKAAVKEEVGDDENEVDVERKVKAKAKRARKVVKKEVDEDVQPDLKLRANKGRKAAVKEEVGDDENEVDVEPEVKEEVGDNENKVDVEPEVKAKVERARKAVKKEVDEDIQPDMKSRANKGRKVAVKEDLDEDVEPDVKPKVNRRRKAVIKAEVDDHIEPDVKPKASRGSKADVQEELESDAPAKSNSKTAARKGRKEAIKKEQEPEFRDSEDGDVKGEPVDAGVSLATIPSGAQDAQTADVSAGNEAEATITREVDDQDKDEVKKTQPKKRSRKRKDQLVGN